MARQTVGAISLLVIFITLLPTTGALTTPPEGTWVRHLDPLAETPDEWKGAEAPDGDFGVFYDLTNPKFARSPDGSNTWPTKVVIVAKTGIRDLALAALESNTWRVLFADSTNHWFVYESTDDGATWTLKQDITQDLDSISIAHTPGFTHIVGKDSSDDIRYYRSSDGLATFDKSNILLAGGTFVRGEIVAWDDTHLEIWYESAPSAVMSRLVSEDNGNFWGAGNALSTQGQGTYTGGGFDVSLDPESGILLHIVNGAISGTFKVFTYEYNEWNGAATSCLDGPTGTTTCSFTCQTSGPVQCAVFEGSVSVNGEFANLMVVKTATGAPCDACPLEWANGVDSWGQITGLPTGYPTTFTGITQIVNSPTRHYELFRNANQAGRFEIHVLGLEGTTTGGSLQDSWCSNPTIANYNGDPDADFGYNYVEQVDFIEDTSTEDLFIDLNDAYKFTSQSDDAAYMGKGWEGTASRAKVVFRIEAETDSLNSVFRAHLSFVSDTPSSSSKGDGLTTGSFTDYIAARFEENGPMWQITITYNNGGQPTPIQYGSAVNYNEDPDNPHTFSLDVNTTGSGYIRVRSEDNDQTIIEVPNIATSGLPFLVPFAGDDPMYSQWFITTATQGAVNVDTYLDDPDTGQDDDSTCIFFDEQVSITGEQGTAPPSTVPNPGPDTDGDGIPDSEDPDDDNDGIPDAEDSTPLGGGGGGIGNLPDWVMPTILTYITALILAAILCILVSRGEVAIIVGFLFLATIFSIYAWGMPWFIPVIILVLPSLAILIWKGPWR